MRGIKKTSNKVAVVQDPDDTVPVQVLAKHIRDLSAAAGKLLSAGLKEETIVLLLHDHTKIGKPHIRAVLRGLPELANAYLSKGAE